eukprot:c9147_g1_i1.p1 GENE.c9147_g1_i1~~c9147_g1_i1.p1  ORF type:complete len:243 (-),score=66.36 c9147_g1_i1:59-733(-)
MTSTFPMELVGHMSKEPRLAGKICIVSGANRGFGQAIAVRFVEEGAKVVCFSRGGCTETLEMIGTIKGLEGDVSNIAINLNCDISSEKSVIEMVTATIAKFGPRIDVLVNNAALFVFESVETATAEDWDNTCAVNIKGHALVTKHVLPHMKQPANTSVPMRGNGAASIVFQGSISSFVAQPNCTTYSTVKAGIVQMARNCAYDFAKYNIRQVADMCFLNWLFWG